MRRLSAALSVILLLSLAGCFRQATDETAAGPRPRFTGTAPWTINGVRPGQTLAEVRRVLGEARESRGRPEQPTLFWSRPEVAVTFDEAGVATEVMGNAVQSGGQTIVTGGDSEAQVALILGPATEIQKAYRPKGSGVISLGREPTGTTLIYDNAGVRFELPVAGEADGHFLARLPPARKR